MIALVLSLRRKSKFGLLAWLYLLASEYRSLVSYIIAQAKVETAEFTSRVYQEDNNMFGMKVNSRPFETPGLMSPEGNRYAHYRNDFDSVRDFVAWMRQTNFPTRVGGAEGYALEMKQRGYYGPSANQYAQNLNFWLYGNQ